MDKKHNSKNNLIQRIKQINKNNNIDYTEFLIKYCPRNIQKEHNIITCVDYKSVTTKNNNRRRKGKIVQKYER